MSVPNTDNARASSPGYSPFQLKTGRSPRILPPLLPTHKPTATEDISAAEIIAQLERDVLDAQDNLLAAKITQAEQSNKDRGTDPDYQIGGRVKLNTKNRRGQYLRAGEGRCAKFMPRFDGPYNIIGVHKECSTVTLDMTSQPGVFPVFHTSEVEPYIENDPILFPNRQLPRPGPITTEDGEEEWEIDEIIDERRRGRGVQYLVR
jgi:hypothetical protein